MKKICYFILGLVLAVTLTVYSQSNTLCHARSENLYMTIIEDYQEYLDHINNNTMRTDFVSFSEIDFNAELNFVGFQLIDATGECGYYDYSFRMSDGGTINLRVNHAGHHEDLWEDKPIIERPDLIDNMRDISTNEPSVIYINDIRYAYLQTRLYFVEFVVDDIQFRWSFYPVDEFPAEQGTFIERLLHASTATEARDEFAASIRGKHPLQVVRQVLMWGIPAFVVIGLGTFGIIYRRKCKRTSK